MHAFAKRAVEHAERALEVNGQLTAAHQDILESDMKAWNIIWNHSAGEAATPWRTAEEGGRGAQLAPPTAKEHRAAAHTFQERRSYAWRSDGLLERIGEFMAAVEQTGRWPTQAGEAWIHLIPKTTTGRRPIALLHALLLLWDRVWAWRIRQWRTENAKKYNWMVEGKGPRRAVWAQSVLQEAANREGCIRLVYWWSW